MAIDFDAASENYFGTPATSHTLAHTTSGSDRFLVNFLLTNGTTTDIVSTSKYNAVDLTSAIEMDTGQANVRLYAYYLITPATGSNNLVVTLSQSSDCDVKIQSYTGCKQSGQPDATSSGSNPTNITLGITTVADNCWLASCARNTSSGPMSAGTGTTRRTSTGTMSSGDSNAAKTPAGSHSMQWINAAGDSDGLIISIAPATAAAATNDALFFAGN